MRRIIALRPSRVMIDGKICLAMDCVYRTSHGSRLTQLFLVLFVLMDFTTHDFVTWNIESHNFSIFLIILVQNNNYNNFRIAMCLFYKKTFLSKVFRRVRHF